MFIEQLMPALRKGAKIRRRDWLPGVSIGKHEDVIVVYSNAGQIAGFYREFDVSLLKTDWEIFEDISDN
jgi:hypothetical protein